MLIPGGRDVRGPLDGGDARVAVVACPPHPRQGGSRSDRRVRAVSDALAAADVACLRIDYGPWDEGYGERADAVAAVEWARERYERVGIFGYSFGGTVALLAAAAGDVDAVAALAPEARLASDLDAVSALSNLGVPVQVVYGERDETVAWRPLVEAAGDRGDDVVGLPADHFFVGHRDRVGETVATFLAAALAEG